MAAEFMPHSSKLTRLLLLSVALFWSLLVFAGAKQARAERPAQRPMPTSIPGSPQGEGPLGPMGSEYANLVIERIEVQPSVPLVGSEFTVLVTVANRGTGHPTNRDGKPANFWVDLFVDPPVPSAEDLLSMPAFPPAASAGVQASWLPPGASYVVSFTCRFPRPEEQGSSLGIQCAPSSSGAVPSPTATPAARRDPSGVHDLYAVVDIAELDLPTGNVYEGGAAGERDNAFGPHPVEVRYPNMIVAKDNADFVRGPASSLAIVPVPTGSLDSSRGQMSGQALTVGDAALTLGYFEEPPAKWGLRDPESPDYNMVSLDTRLNDDESGRPQEWVRLAANDGLVVAVWQDRRNSGLTDWDIYLTWSSDHGDTWHTPNLRVNDDAIGEADQRRPAVAISPAGDRILVVWQDNRRDPRENPDGRYRIFGRWYAVIGGVLVPDGANFVIGGNPGVNCLAPDVAAGPEGNFYVVWQDDRSGNTDIWLRGWSDAGGWMSQARRISDDPQGSNQRAPRVSAGRSSVLKDWRTSACLGQGRAEFEIVEGQVSAVFIAWEDDRNGDADIYATYSIDEAQTFARDIRVNDDTKGTPQLQPAVGMAEAWVEIELWDKDGLCPKADDGRPAAATKKVPVAAFYAVWQDFRNSTQGRLDNPDIYLSQLRLTGTGGLITDLTATGNERMSPPESTPIWQEHPAVACRTYTGEEKSWHNAFVVWADRRNWGVDNVDIYMAVRGDSGGDLPEFWADGVIQVNSNAHIAAAGSSRYPGYDALDPPPAHQAHPAVAADITRTLFDPTGKDIWEHTGYVYVAWDDNRADGIDRDIHFTRSNMTYMASYAFYPDPMRSDQLPVGGTCRYGSGSYISPIYDAGTEDVTWGRIEWHALTPSGTYLTLQTRVGNDPANMGEWQPKDFPYGSVGLPALGAPLQGYHTPGQPIVGPDGQPRPKGRYIQYRVNMWAWPQGGPSSYWCGAIGEEQKVWDPVASSPVLYSVTLHYEANFHKVFLPVVSNQKQF